MAVVRIARRPLLAAMRLHREDIGAVDQRLVGGGVVGPYFLDKFILSQHRSNMGCGALSLQCKKLVAGAGVALFQLLGGQRLAFDAEASEGADFPGEDRAPDGGAAIALATGR